jgi:hypothetical protein
MGALGDFASNRRAAAQVRQSDVFLLVRQFFNERLQRQMLCVLKPVPAGMMWPVTSSLRQLHGGLSHNGQIASEKKNEVTKRESILSYRYFG